MNLLCFYTLIKSNQKEKLRKQTHLQLQLKKKKKKQLAINLTMKVKDLYSETYKIFMKETEADTNECKDIQCSLIGRMTIIQIIMLPMAIYRFNTNPVISSIEI